MDAAMPKQTVLTSQGMNCMVSKMAIPLEIDPPRQSDRLLDAFKCERDRIRTWTIDIHGDIGLWIFVREVKQLRYDSIRHVIIDSLADHYDSIVHSQLFTRDQKF